MASRDHGCITNEARTLFATLCAAAAIIAFIGAMVAYYARETIHSQEGFTTELADFFDTSAGRDLIADRMTDTIFVMAEVDRPTDDSGALPGLLERTLEARVPQAVDSVLDGQGEPLAAAAMADVHRQVVLALADRSDEIAPDGTVRLDLRPVLEMTIDEVVDRTDLTALEEAQRPPGAGVIAVIARPQGGELLWNMTESAPDLFGPAMFVALAFGAVAILVAPTRSATVKLLAAGVAIAAVVMLAAAWVTRGTLPILVDDSAAARAAQAAHASLMQPFIRLMLVVAAVAVIVWVGASLLDLYFARREEEQTRLQVTGPVLPQAGAPPPGGPPTGPPPPSLPGPSAPPPSGPNETWSSR